MVRPTFAHALIIANLLVPLTRPARARGYDALTDFLIEVDGGSGYVPDVVIIGGSLDLKSRRSSEPVIVFEVLSPTTLDFDRGAKARAYRSIATLEQIVFVYQDSVRVESWTRVGSEWPSRPEILTGREQTLSLNAIAAGTTLDVIYERVVPSPLMD